MRLFLGILLGIFITIAGAYVYDSMTTGSAATAAQASPGDVNRPMVNWDVVDHNWRAFQNRVRHTWTRLVERT